MTQTLDPERDLSLSRIIKAPRATVWSAWTTPASLEKWWVPEPALCKVVKFQSHPGGAFETHISEDGGAFVPHVTGCILAADKDERFVFTDTLLGGWRPAEQPFMTALITFADHPQGTDYRAHVMHKSKADRDNHEKMGFYDGWGTVADQLARLVE
jgi:uncharacterized protein YndB with AHSA1/START domain